MKNDDGLSIFWVFLLLLGFGIYEYMASDPSMLMFEGSFEIAEVEEISYFGAIRFNVDVSQGKVLSLSGLNNVIKELNECSVFDDENWTCNDYYLGEIIGKIDGKWLTPDWLRPINYDLEWLYIKHLRHIVEGGSVPFLFGQASFKPIIELYTSTDAVLLNQVKIAQDKVEEISSEFFEPSETTPIPDEQLDEYIDALNELFEIYDRVAIEGARVLRLPIADHQVYGWRIRIPEPPIVSITRTEQTNQANSQHCYVDAPLEEYCVFEGLAEIVLGEDGTQYIHDGYVTELNDPAGIYKYRVFIDGMYQGEAEAEFYSP
jgi:hypothetical protein